MDKEALTPVPSGAVKTICEKLVDAITLRENGFGRHNSNIKFKAELEEIRFCNIVEGVVTKWTAMNHDVESRKNKREQSIVGQKADKERSKSQKSNPAPALPLLSTSVGEHCDKCGKSNHKRKDCIQGESESKHPDFNETGAWLECETYLTIKDWLISRGRAGAHPVLKYNLRAVGTSLDPPVKGRLD